MEKLGASGAMKLSEVTRSIEERQAVDSLCLPVSKACLTAGRAKEESVRHTFPGRKQPMGKTRGLRERSMVFWMWGRHRGSTAGMKVQLQPLLVSALKNHFLILVPILLANRQHPRAVQEVLST